MVELTEAAIAGASLPEDTELDVLPLNINEEVAISYALLTDGEFTDDLIGQVETGIIPELETIPGVLRVDLLGTGASAETSTTVLAETTSDPTQTPVTLVRFNAEDALAIQVVKQGNANTLEVVRQVEDAVADLAPDFPDLTLELATTQANYIREATQATIDALWLAIALAILVIFRFPAQLAGHPDYRRGYSPLPAGHVHCHGHRRVQPGNHYPAGPGPGDWHHCG